MSLMEVFGMMRTRDHLRVVRSLERRIEAETESKARLGERIADKVRELKDCKDTFDGAVLLRDQRISELQDKLASAESARAVAVQDKLAERSRADELERERDAALAKVAEHESALREWFSRLETLTEERNALKDKCVELEGTVGDLKGKVNRLEMLEKRYSHQMDRLARQRTALVCVKGDLDTLCQNLKSTFEFVRDFVGDDAQPNPGAVAPPADSADAEHAARQ